MLLRRLRPYASTTPSLSQLSPPPPPRRHLQSYADSTSDLKKALTRFSSSPNLKLLPPALAFDVQSHIDFLLKKLPTPKTQDEGRTGLAPEEGDNGAVSKRELMELLSSLRAEQALELSSQALELSSLRADVLTFSLPSLLAIAYRAVDLTYLRKVELLSLGESEADFKKRKENMEAAAEKDAPNSTWGTRKAVHLAKRVVLTVRGAGLDPSTDPLLLLKLSIQRCLDWAHFHDDKSAPLALESYRNLLDWDDLPRDQRTILERSEKDCVASTQLRNEAAHSLSLGLVAFTVQQYQLARASPHLPLQHCAGMPHYSSMEAQLNFLLDGRWQDVDPAWHGVLLFNPPPQS